MSIVSNDQVHIDDTNDLPKYTNGSPGKLWKQYAYNPDGEVGGEGRLGPWIGDSGSGYQVGSKGLKLMARGFGPTELYTYVGDGTPNSGYAEIFLFFRVYFPHNAFPTNTDPNDNSTNHGKVEYNQTVFNTDGYLWLTGLKFVNFGTGFTSVNTHPSGCFYGDGEGWVDLFNTYNDRGQHVLFGFSTCGYTGCNGENCWGTTSIPFDELGAIEIRLQIEKYSNGVLTQYGELEIWKYDSNGNAAALIPKRTKITVMQKEDKGHLINRILLNGNKHRYDGTGPPTSPSKYNRSVGEYKLGKGMAKFWYVDDVIIDDQRIGPKYFSLLGGSSSGDGGGSTTPNPPANVRIQNNN